MDFNNYNKDNAIYIDGVNDPFGINDVMIKMVELLDERYDIFSGEDTDEPLVIDFTSFSEAEMDELVREAIACIEFENEILNHEWNKGKALHYYS